MNNFKNVYSLLLYKHIFLLTQLHHLFLNHEECFHVAVICIDHSSFLSVYTAKHFCPLNPITPFPHLTNKSPPQPYCSHFTSYFSPISHPGKPPPPPNHQTLHPGKWGATQMHLNMSSVQANTYIQANKEGWREREDSTIAHSVLRQNRQLVYVI